MAWKKDEEVRGTVLEAAQARVPPLQRGHAAVVLIAAGASSRMLLPPLLLAILKIGRLAGPTAAPPCGPSRRATSPSSRCRIGGWTDDLPPLLVRHRQPKSDKDLYLYLNLLLNS
jgi:hypothetical protein